jgi:signal transduction histidine kinase
MAITSEPIALPQTEARPSRGQIKGMVQFLTDRNGQLVNANPNARAFFGLPEKGDFPPATGLKDIVTSPLMQNGLDAHFSSLGGQPEATSIIDIEGGKVVQVTTMKNEQDGSLDTFCVDVTAAVQREKEMARGKIDASESRAAAAEKAAVNIAHDVRGQAAAIFSIVDYLSEMTPSLSKDAVSLLEGIKNSTERITDISRDYTALLKPETQVNLAPVDLEILMHDLQLQFAPEQAGKQASITVQKDMPTPIADEKMLYQMYVNLVSNALKYSGRNPNIEINAVPLENGKVRYEVKDHGQGIPLERQAELFTRFGRLDLPEHRGITGTGVGLAIVKKLAELQGGTVGVESKIGEGSTFYFILDAAPASQEETPDK